MNLSSTVTTGNGNMVKDLNKGISRIEYNFLNLSRRVTFIGANNPVNEYGRTYATGIDIHKADKNEVSQGCQLIDINN